MCLEELVRERRDECGQDSVFVVAIDDVRVGVTFAVGPVLLRYDGIVGVEKVRVGKGGGIGSGGIVGIVGTEKGGSVGTSGVGIVGSFGKQSAPRE